MLRALKNDVIALEYPIQFFLSQCIRNGEIPTWFNSWGMGFPLQSTLTWGVFSTPQVLFSTLFDYNIYTLHFEFMFFIILSGAGMFSLLKKHFPVEERIALLLSVSYMLSGFMVGSAQWLLYITAAAFLPLLLSGILDLLRNPSPSAAFRTAVWYTLMFTSVYQAFNIISTYSLIIIFLVWAWNNRKNKIKLRGGVKGMFMAGLFTVLLCLPALYFTFELLGQVERGGGLSAESTFFFSNYLHPGALGSMLFPFSSVRMIYENTEGTMLDTYAGLFVLGVLPLAALRSVSEKNKPALLLLVTALLFLIISFGHFTPLRSWLNYLPGFSYFRNPAIFRLFFIFSLVLFTASAFRNLDFRGILQHPVTRYSYWLAAAGCAWVILQHAGAWKPVLFSSFQVFIRQVDFPGALLTAATIQLFFLAVLIIMVHYRRYAAAAGIFLADLVLNTLLCTAFFTVSSYTLPQQNALLEPVIGFPAQTEPPGQVPAVFTDFKGNQWQNVNVFTKKVSAQPSYRGPLVLKALPDSFVSPNPDDLPLVYLDNNPYGEAVSIRVQKPGYVQGTITAERSGTLTLLQNYYPGWKVYINGQQADISGKRRPGISVHVPAGVSTFDFRYERKEIWITALLLHLVILGYGVMQLTGTLKNWKFRSSSPS